MTSSSSFINLEDKKAPGMDIPLRTEPQIHPFRPFVPTLASRGLTEHPRNRKTLQKLINHQNHQFLGGKRNSASRIIPFINLKSLCRVVSPE